MVWCTVLYCTVLYCTILYCTVLYCTLLLSFSEAAGLLDTSLASCDTNAGGTIRPRGDQSLYLPSTKLDNFPADLVVKTSCGARFKMGLVIRGTKTNIRNPVLTYLGK